MTTEEAKKQLREMQSQIIHGTNVFGDIADVIVRLEAKNKPNSVPSGAELIAEERATHESKGFTAAHDDQHTDLDIPPVAIHLILDCGDSNHDWGLVEKTKREGGRIRQLVVAGSLIAAEIDRLQRIQKVTL